MFRDLQIADLAAAGQAREAQPPAFELVIEDAFDLEGDALVADDVARVQVHAVPAAVSRQARAAGNPGL